jgi:2-C-methyl-D-erythritol 4-phosphate cytidylyltransferase
MGPGVDKLFFEVAGRPVVAHTWQRFDGAPAIDALVIVVQAGHEPAFAELADRFGYRKPYRLVPGGAERQDSVWNGLEAVDPATEIVAIQDGARPCTSAALIAATIEAAREGGAAVAAQPVADTIKRSDDGRTISGHLDRSRLWAVQTPQTFRLGIIRQALGLVRERGLTVTDDTAACELVGQPVRLVESAEPNPKVTTRWDLPVIERHLNAI